MARFIGYPRGRLLAVLDEPIESGRALEALVAAGIAPDRIEVFRGDTAADAFDGVGRRHGALARTLRSIQFALMDQMPDFAWYEAAIRAGRSVVSVRVSDDPSVRTAVAVLRDHGAHFVNRFGRFSTEEFDRWRGPEPVLPGYLRR